MCVYMIYACVWTTTTTTASSVEDKKRQHNKGRPGSFVEWVVRATKWLSMSIVPAPLYAQDDDESR